MSVGVAVVLGWAVLAMGFSAVALVRLLARRRAATRLSVPVLLLRPVEAPTAQELESLAHPIAYEGPLEHVVLSPTQPPRLPAGVRWVQSEPATPNRKVGHLLRALDVLRTEGRVVVVVDADVAVTGALLEGLAAPVAAGAALSTAVPTPVGARTLASRAVVALLRRTHHSFRALHAMSAGAKAVCGKALGLSARALQELPVLAEHIGEDLELARRLHARGEQVVLCEAPAVVPLGEGGSLRSALQRFTRWMQVLASHRPELYPTVPLLFTPTWVLLLLSLLMGSPVVAAVVAALVGVRTLLSWRLTVLSEPEPGSPARERHPPLDWLLGEALLLAAFACSLWRRGQVTWRGRTYALRPGGRMTPVWPELSGGRG